MRCNEVLELQSALLDSELSARESGDVEAHLAACTRCQATLRDMQNLSGSLRARPSTFGTGCLAFTNRGAGSSRWCRRCRWRGETRTTRLGLRCVAKDTPQRLSRVRRPHIS